MGITEKSQNTLPRIELMRGTNCHVLLGVLKPLDQCFSNSHLAVGFSSTLSFLPSLFGSHLISVSCLSPSCIRDNSYTSLRSHLKLTSSGKPSGMPLAWVRCPALHLYKHCTHFFLQCTHHGAHLNMDFRYYVSDIYLSHWNERLESHENRHCLFWVTRCLPSTTLVQSSS